MTRPSRDFPRRDVMTPREFVSKWIGVVIGPHNEREFEGDRLRVLAWLTEQERRISPWTGRGEVAHCERRVRA